MVKVIVPALFVVVTLFGGVFVEAKTPQSGKKKTPAVCCTTKEKPRSAACCADLNCCVGQTCDMDARCCAPGSDCCVDGQCTASQRAKKGTR